jgi:flagellar secretion chaperone FliS
MTMTTTEMSYQRSAIQGASPIGLMIALFDRLAGDLRRAAAALRKNDIETRCKELNHAALVLGQLENWVDVKNGGESAQTLSRFYAYLRAKMVEAAGRKSAKLLEMQIDMILLVRTSWQQLDTPPPQVSQIPAEISMRAVRTPFEEKSDTENGRTPFSYSA